MKLKDKYMYHTLLYTSSLHTIFVKNNILYNFFFQVRTFIILGRIFARTGWNKKIMKSCIVTTTNMDLFRINVCNLAKYLLSFKYFFSKHIQLWSQPRLTIGPIGKKVQATPPKIDHVILYKVTKIYF